MRLQSHAGVAEFLATAHSVLAVDEARHNLMYGICGTLTESPTAYPEAHFWTVLEDGVPLAAVLRTPPFNFVVARPLREDALTFVVERLPAEDGDAPGVTGGLPEVEQFAHRWTETPRLRMAQGVYAARAVRLPEGVPGAMRLATLGDSDLIVDWLHDFSAEALPDDAPHLDANEVVERRLRSTTAGMALWEVEGRSVSLCGFGSPTPHGIRIGPVYTPPELRGHGYGSAVTAAASQRLLDGGREFCFLHTDLANPTSNKIYVAIGYELVCEFADYAFG